MIFYCTTTFVQSFRSHIYNQKGFYTILASVIICVYVFISNNDWPIGGFILDVTRSIWFLSWVSIEYLGLLLYVFTYNLQIMIGQQEVLFQMSRVPYGSCYGIPEKFLHSHNIFKDEAISIYSIHGNIPIFQYFFYISKIYKKFQKKFPKNVENSKIHYFLSVFNFFNKICEYPYQIL